MKNRKKRLPAVAMAVVLSATSSVGPVIPVLAEESHTSAVVEDQAETLSEAAAPEEHQEEEVQNPEVSSEEAADETVSGSISEGTADETASGNVSEEEKPAEDVLTETEEGPAGEIPEEKPSDDAIAPTEEKVSPLEEALSGVLEDAALLEVKPEIPIDAEALADAEDGSVKINAENFPDSDFRGYLYKYCDSNKDMQLSPEEIQKITSIDVSRRNLASLEGIAYFPYLKTLSCVGTKITELDVSGNLRIGSNGMVEEVSRENFGSLSGDVPWRYLYQKKEEEIL